jgi:5'-nucleotidase
MQRRHFIKETAFTTGALLLSKFDLLANEENALTKLTILHTNDVHSRIDPFPMDGGRNQGMGGVAARASLINKIRSEENNILLLDAGDIFQGTPYFNLYKGEPEIKAMAAMGYDACTMGNHDFDAGMENFATQLSKGNFPMLNCNYGFTDTPLENIYQPYKIFKKGNLKIGVMGIGLEMRGLVPDSLYGNTIYNDPIIKANETANKLKKEEKCNLVICLSHLGYKYADNKVSDQVLAKETEYIDLIIGGHTHTFLSKPESIKNKLGSDVLVNQVGWGGIQLGRLDFEFSKKNGKNFLKSHTLPIQKKTPN